MKLAVPLALFLLWPLGAQAVTAWPDTVRFTLPTKSQWILPSPPYTPWARSCGEIPTPRSSRTSLTKRLDWVLMATPRCGTDRYRRMVASGTGMPGARITAPYVCPADTADLIVRCKGLAGWGCTSNTLRRKR